MLVERLRAQWRVREALGNISRAPAFEEGQLVLGAGTVLAKSRHDEPTTDSVRDAARLSALLSAAYQRKIDGPAIEHLKKASLRWSEGQRDRAAVHLALANLGKLDEPVEAARRLFMADGLMRNGVAPDLILDVVEQESLGSEAVRKCSPDQPRVPAGSGRPSGEWASGGGAAASGRAGAQRQRKPVVTPPKTPKPVAAQRTLSSSPQPGPVAKPSRSLTPPTIRSYARPSAASAVGVLPLARPAAGIDLAAMSQRALAALADFAMGAVDTGALGAVAAVGGAAGVAGILFIPSTGPQGRWVKISGPGNISYYHNPDEQGFKFRFTPSDGIPRTINASPDPNGDFRGPNGRVIARALKAAGKIGLVVATGELLSQDDDDPKLCPKPVPENHGTRGRVYEDFNKLQFNPGNPTPSGYGYRLRGPGVKPNPTYDDCQQLTGGLADYKGPMYTRLLFINEKLQRSVLEKFQIQADDEDVAKGARSLTWRFEEKEAADFMRTYLHEHNPDINVEWWPMPSDQQ